MPHLPVLLRETINLLELKPGARIIDCTFGDGGHSKAILALVPAGRLLGIDVDAQNIIKARQQREFKKKNVILANGNYRDLEKMALANNFREADAILFDLGWSSTQFEERGRGFSFLRDEPLDMRLGTAGLAAADILNNWSELELGRILREYGEEKKWKEIVRAIIDHRHKKLIRTTGQLTAILASVFGPRRFGKRFSIHPATKTFQALRVAVNDELSALQEGLPQAVKILKSGGRLAVISFHSLEDRMVKRFFKNSRSLKIITKKPITANREEILNNPRSRSAKLRVAEKS